MNAQDLIEEGGWTQLALSESVVVTKPVWVVAIEDIGSKLFVEPVKP